MTRYKERFHQAARDGYLDLLRDATRSEADGADESGMSPVMWAAFYGNLDALRLLIQRGGSPDKADHMGSTALHFAALNGHMHCVTYLVNFGANIWTLDNDYHTALDLAGLRGHQEIVEYLDGVAGRQAGLNKRVVAKLREKAALEAQKRVKKFDRMLHKTSKRAAKEDRQRQLLDSTLLSASSAGTAALRPGGSGTSNPNYQRRRRSLSFGHGGGGSGGDGGSRSGSLSDLATSGGTVQLRQLHNGAGGGGAPASSREPPRPFSEYLLSSTGGRGTRGAFGFGAARKVVSHKQHQHQSQHQHQQQHQPPSREDGHSLGLTLRGSADVVYARTSADGRSVLSGPASEPDMQQQPPRQDSADLGLFERPGFGSVAFFHHHSHPAGAVMARTLNSFRDDPRPLVQAAAAGAAAPSPTRTQGRLSYTDSIGTSGSLLRRWRDLPWSDEDVDNLEDDYDYLDGEGEGDAEGGLRRQRQTDLELFLACLGLEDCGPAMAREQLDLGALGLCTDEDLRGLGLPMGPRRKILDAVQRRKEAFEARDRCLRDLRL